MLELLFWVLLTGALYSYFLYPLVLVVLRRFRSARPQPPPASTQPPTFSLIVTVYNEQARIRDKLDNMLRLVDPGPGFEMLIASDCSDDDTDSIVAGYSGHGVRLVRAAERLGKENAQLSAIREARGEVLVFSDVATIMEPDALVKLAAWFADPQVGAVSSEDRFVSKDGTVAGEGAYVKYEMWLRQQESALGGLVGLSGSFFAARREICQAWDIHAPSDFNTALNCARAGMRSLSAPDVLGYYEDLKDPGKEYARKVRTALRGMTGLARHADVLNPARFGLFALQVWSHKVMRWAVPWLLAALLAVTLLVREHHWMYTLALAGQLAFYLLALGAHLLPALRKVGPVKLVYFFVQVNVALADATIKLFTGTRMTTWQPSQR